ncbi:MAG TPA: DUF899 family protein [Mesorhizobium sp.]|uniref:DUF899 family protein n=1 Tax=Mesorhizobium sp. TaxID=1871066 RepID=UPI002DDD6F82|nr:DUF899 family protein [Mesorhizobium sp.]HEV2505287.1 DUF899 family protein [Mesorhizobium sp.]
MVPALAALAPDDPARISERHGVSVFLRDGGEIYRSYFNDARGVEYLSLWTYLDLTAYGRQETWEDSPAGLAPDRALCLEPAARRIRQLIPRHGIAGSGTPGLKALNRASRSPRRARCGFHRRTPARRPCCGRRWR